MVAPALFTQTAAAGAALEKLSECLDVMAERGEITVPDYDGTGVAERLCSAQSVLGASGQEAFGAIDARAYDNALDIQTTTPYTGMLPANTHETITQLAGLLGDSAKLIPVCQLPVEAGSGARGADDGCHCRIELTDHGAIVWDFHCSDYTWYLMSLADRTPSGSPEDPPHRIAERAGDVVPVRPRGQRAWGCSAGGPPPHAARSGSPYRATYRACRAGHLGKRVGPSGYVEQRVQATLGRTKPGPPLGDDADRADPLGQPQLDQLPLL